MSFNFCFSSFGAVSIDISSAVRALKLCVVTAATKKYGSIIKKKMKKHDKIVLSPKTKLSNLKTLTSRTLINSSISHDESVLVNKVFKEYLDTNEEIQNSKPSKFNQRF